MSLETVTEHVGEQVTYQRVAGSNLLEIVTKNLTKSFAGGIISLVANSYDADATRVDITLLENKVVIKDNGIGMSSEDLRAIFTAGDSPKAERRVSPKGRHYLGNFGLDSFQLPNLAERYTIETVKDGVKTIVSEDFKKTKAKHAVNGKKFPTNEPPGTTMILEGLRFSTRSELTANELKSAFAWNLPVCHDSTFQVFVNYDPVKFKPLENSTKFAFHAEGEYIGVAEGKLYLTRTPVKEAGLYIRVHGRTIGDPKALVNFSEIKNTLSTRVIGIVDAPGMEKYIALDRCSFLPGDGVSELKSHLNKALRRVADYQERQRHSNQSENMSKKADILIADLWRYFQKSMIPEVIEGMHFYTVGEVPKDAGARVSQDSKSCFINLEYPAFQLEGVLKNKTSFRVLLAEEIVDAIALHRSQGNIERYTAERVEIFNRLLMPTQTTGQKRQIFEDLFYSESEIASVAGCRSVSIRYMVDHEALTRHPEDGILGRNYLQLMQRTHGLMPLPEFIYNHLSTLNVPQATERIDSIVEIIGAADASPFFIGFGTSRNCYFIDELSAKNTAELIKNIDLRSGEKSPSVLWPSYKNQFLTLPAMAEKLSISVQNVTSVLDFSKDSRLPMRTHQFKGAGIGFNYADFIAANQAYRQHKNC